MFSSDGYLVDFSGRETSFLQIEELWMGRVGGLGWRDLIASLSFREIDQD